MPAEFTREQVDGNRGAGAPRARRGGARPVRAAARRILATPTRCSRSTRPACRRPRAWSTRQAADRPDEVRPSLDRDDGAGQCARRRALEARLLQGAASHRMSDAVDGSRASATPFRSRSALGGRRLPRRARAHRGARSGAARVQHRHRRAGAGARRGASIATSIAGATRRWPACRSRSRTTCARAASAPPRRRGCSKRYVPPYDATVVDAARSAPARSSSARPTATSSPWARRPRTRRSGRRGIRGRSTAFRADRAADRPRRSRRGMTPLALGSDTGGSIRQPAALCGVVGLKPTYGRVSRYGLLAFASSLDQIGPLTRTVHDAALTLAVIAGADPADATSAPEPVPDYAAALTGDVRGVRIGVPRALLEQGVDADVSRAFDDGARHAARRAARRSSTSSCRTRGTPSPSTTWSRPPRRARTSRATTACATASVRRAEPGTTHDLRTMYARHARAGLRRRGEAPHHARHLRAERRLLRRVLPEGAAGPHADPARLRARVRARVDVVAMPTSPTPAFRLGERVDDPLQMYLADVFTVSANLAGLPAISVPCGFTRRSTCRSACS